jgi:prolyl-tRNA synthetase
MKDSYSLDADFEGLDVQYRAHYQAYFNIFHRCGLPVIAVKSDVGMMGGNLAHEFMYLAPVGEDTLMLCEGCGYSANRQVSVFRKPLLPHEEPLPVEKVATPEMKTIADLAEFLNIPESQTAKAVFLIATIPEGEDTREQFVFVVLRGDMELNENKLVNAIKAQALRPAMEDEIIAVGAVPGYASPLGLEDVQVVVDDIIPDSPNLVAGANQEGYHLRNVNYGRDYQADIVVDIAAAQDGDACPECGAKMKAQRGIEVGNIFKLGTRYSEAMGAEFLDADGVSKPVVMGSYGIGSGRTLACVAEEYHDDDGLVLPVSVAPYQVHLVLLTGKGDEEPSDAAERLYLDLQAAGVEVLFDDRQESPGVKFNDADLIGLPIRLTVSQRSLKAGGVEFKRRDQADRRVILFDQIIPVVKDEIDALQKEIDQRVIAIDFRED